MVGSHSDDLLIPRSQVQGRKGKGKQGVKRGSWEQKNTSICDNVTCPFMPGTENKKVNNNPRLYNLWGRKDS